MERMRKRGSLQGGRQLFAIGIIGLLLLSALPAFAKGSSQKQESEKIRFGIQTGDMQAIIALHNGYFKEEGLDVDLTVFAAGPEIIAAFTSKSLDFGLVGDLPAASGIANGVDLKIVGVYMTTSSLHGLVVRDAANIKTLADLRGKKAAVPFGTNAQPLLYLYLEKAGLTDKDVEILNLNIADISTSIVAGSIDAAVAWEPQLTLAAAPGNGVTKLHSAEGFKLFVNPIIARGDFITKHPEETAKLLRAFNRASVWAKDHVEEAAQIVYEDYGVAPEVTVINLTKSDRTPTLTPERIQAIIFSTELNYKYGLLTQPVDIGKYIDTSYLEAAGVQ